MKPPLWKHQQAAIDFTLRLWSSGMRRGVMLALCMGAGKSRTAIRIAELIAARLVLILCPLRVVEVWRRQFAEYADSEYHFLALDERAGSVDEKCWAARDALRWWTTGPQRRLAIAINYESARLDPFASWALANIWPLIIADEIHKAKSPSSRTSRYLAKLSIRAGHRMGLTGTPMAHEPLDIWGQFRFLDPSILEPTYGLFKQTYAVWGGFHNKQVLRYRDLDALNEKFYRISFRVTDEVLDLPPVLDEPLFAALTPKGRKYYDDMERDLIAWIEESDSAAIAANALSKLVRLQQITSGFIKDANGNEVLVDAAKEHVLTDFLEDLDTTEPVVVFCRFKHDLAAVHRCAQATGRTSGELSGSREEHLQWSAGKLNVLAVQINAGETGIDLSRTRYGVYFSHGFSLSTYLQSRKRIHRPPQSQSVVFYHILVRNTIDEAILRAIERREELISAALADLRTKGVPYVKTRP